ncbi:hypothetical protein ACP4OV_031809 [Aristida adscensionis]
MSSSLPADDGAESGTRVASWSAASPVGGDVALSGVAILFVALAFAFVLYHYFALRPRGSVDGRAAATAGGGQRGTVRGGGDAAAGPGVDPVVLRTLPVTVYRAKGLSGDEAPECAVCLAELADGEAARFLPRCGHGFHAECVDMWLRAHPTCPLCRGDIDKAGAHALPSAPSPAALPPALPEPANYATNLPTNVLFWGSQDAVTTTARTVDADVGDPSSSGGAAAVVIEVREHAPAVAPPREGGARKPEGWARLSSLRRLWSRGRHEAAATGSRSCRRGTTGGDTEQAPASPLDIWNLT